MKKSSTSLLSLYYAIALIAFFLTPKLSYTQNNPLNNYSNSFDKLKDKSKDFNISGSLSLASKYRFAAQQGKPFEYNAQANLNLSYMGISMPLSYRLTSGRSIIGLNSPSINIPKFQDFGLSPNYKHYTLHLGTRQMQFTPYTYTGIRFQGIGTEVLPENGIFLKAFKGKLRSPFEEFVNLTSNQSANKARKAFGIQSGFKSKNSQYAFAIFKAQDDPSLLPDSDIIKPKENAAIAFTLNQQFSELITLKFEKAVSAFTRDITSPRVDIQTHTTGYNMFGLFTRRENSSYKYATKSEIQFNLNNAKAALKFEQVDPGYKTLGTVFLDNDFRSYSITLAVPVNDKLFLNGEIGIRNQGFKSNADNKDNNFIGMVNASYQFSDQVNSTLLVSNLRSTQTSFAAINGLLVDSLRLTLSNKLISTTTNYVFGEKKDANLNFLASYMQSTQIREDSLFNSAQVHTSIFNLAYSKRYDKLSSNYMLLFSSNRSEFIANNIIGFTSTHTYRWYEKLNSKHSWNTNLAINSSQSSFVNLISNAIVFNPSKNLEASFTHQLLLNYINEFSVKDHFVEAECRYSF